MSIQQEIIEHANVAIRLFEAEPDGTGWKPGWKQSFSIHLRMLDKVVVESDHPTRMKINEILARLSVI